jgi:hypothetical protein
MPIVHRYLSKKYKLFLLLLPCIAYEILFKIFPPIIYYCIYVSSHIVNGVFKDEY